MDTMTRFDELVDQKMQYIRDSTPSQQHITNDELRAMAEHDVHMDAILEGITPAVISELNSFLLKLNLSLAIDEDMEFYQRPKAREWLTPNIFWDGDVRWMKRLDDAQQGQVMTYIYAQTLENDTTVTPTWYHGEERFRLELKLS